jgi:CHAD domain-containing protein
MEQEKVRRIVDEKVEELSALCRKIGKDFDKDAIHDFRVAVKSLRSFLRLTGWAPQQPGPTLTRKFKRLYHIAGAIRDTQLEMEVMAAELPLIPQYLNKLHMVLARQKREWEKHYSKKTLNKLQDRLNNHNYGDLKVAVLADFLNQRFAAIDEIGRKPAPTDNQVHTIRKLAKDILYTTKLAKKNWGAAKHQSEAISRKQLNKLVDEIGDYNDQRIIQEHLSSFSSRAILPEEESRIRSICSRERKKLVVQKKSIMSRVRALKKV